AYEKGKLGFHGACAFLAKPSAFNRLLRSVRAREWWVYAKRPFGGPAQVLAYLGRYTHRVAISNHRLLSLKHGKVTFSWRDRRHGQVRSTMTLRAEEFMRRFLLHVLPRGFQRIRQFGLLANRRRGELARWRQLLSTTEQPIEPLCQDYQTLYQTVTGTSLRQCPACHTGTMKFFSSLVPLSHYGASHTQSAAAAVLQAIDSS
ncbi:MAG TPA: transposase, partial [Pyrinomonadaceae bacterium]|nr:transposase [Pyrinomonadaceae bacterium]